MAFCVTWTGLNHKNIKHLYSTKETKFPNRRTRIYNPKSLSFEVSERTGPRRERRRLYTYDEKYGASLPRAPAFRDPLPSDYVNGMVDRLTRPNPYKLTPRACAHYQRDFAKYKYEEEDPSDMWHRSPSEVKGIVSRLMEPNVCTRSHYAFTMHDADDDPMTPVGWLLDSAANCCANPLSIFLFNICLCGISITYT